MFSADKVRKLERQRLLQGFGVIAYELARLANEIHQLKDGPFRPGSAKQVNSESAFGSKEDFDYLASKTAQTLIENQIKELNYGRLVEVGLVFLGTIQWGFGDMIVRFLRVYFGQ